MTHTQNQAIRAHLERGLPLTGLAALDLYGTICLPRRILDLKQQGMKIVAKRVKLESGKSVAEYRALEPSLFYLPENQSVSFLPTVEACTRGGVQ